MKENYLGKPYQDEHYSGGAQKIPGRVFCAYYDLGGEGVAYHDADAVNHGSGELNPIDGSYLHSFRVNEGVDTSYTKEKADTDKSAYNCITPMMNMLYVGWTEPGEWFNITVNVQNAGEYEVSLLYTSNQGGAITLSADDKELLTSVAIATTYDANDPIDWRQWHHWNKQILGTVQLPAGEQVLTIKTVENGQMNYAYLEFKAK